MTPFGFDGREGSPAVAGGFADDGEFLKRRRGR